MADGYPIEAQLANTIEREKGRLKKWRYSAEVLLPHRGEKREAPQAGEIFRQPDLAATLRSWCRPSNGRSLPGKTEGRYLRSVRSFLPRRHSCEIARGTVEQGGLITVADLAKWKVHVEEPVKTTYRGIDVYKHPLDPGPGAASGA